MGAVWAAGLISLTWKTLVWHECPRPGVMGSVMVISDLLRSNTSLSLSLCVCVCLRHQLRAKVLMRGSWINSLCIKRRNWITHTHTHNGFGSASVTKFSLCYDTSTFVLILNQHLKGADHPKMKILSSFTYFNVISNLHDFLLRITEHKIYFEGHQAPNNTKAHWLSLYEHEARQHLQRVFVRSTWLAQRRYAQVSCVFGLFSV